VGNNDSGSGGVVVIEQVEVLVEEGRCLEGGVSFMVNRCLRQPG